MKVLADLGACLRNFWKEADCSKCVEACPSGALLIASGKVDIDANLCVGCGICAGVCPTGVFKLEVAGPKISCREGGPCINAFSLADYYELVEKFGEIEVDARCDDCSLKGRGVEVVEEAVRRGLKIKVVRGRGGDVGRRLFLTKALRRASGVGDEKIVVVNRKPHRVNFDKSRRVELGLASRVGPRIDPSRCTACGLCAGVCPSNAVEFNEEAHIFKLDPARCMECGLCVKACQEAAIRLEEWDDLYVDYVFMEAAVCPNCGSTYPATRGECPVCGATIKFIKELYGL